MCVWLLSACKRRYSSQPLCLAAYGLCALVLTRLCGSVQVGTWHPLAMGWLAAQGWKQAPGSQAIDGEPPAVL